MPIMDEPPVDLSPIDPSRDGARWAHLVASVAARARARRRPSFAGSLVRSGVPAFVLAAAAAAAVWIARPRPRVEPARAAEPADLIASWAYGAADPTALVYPSTGGAR